MDILTILTIVLVLIAIGMIALILLQRGAGATTGAAFGSGASGTVFGARGSASFLTRTTGVMAAMFFAIALAMAVMVSRGVGITDNSQNSVMDSVMDSGMDGMNTDQPVPDAAQTEAPEVSQDMLSADDLPVVDDAALSGTDADQDLPAADADMATADDAASGQGADDDNGG
ncbi:MAG: hypothetical protein Tsb0027_17390 [Wenzhouxiangellaceae bacterium]